MTTIFFSNAFNASMLIDVCLCIYDYQTGEIHGVIAAYNNNNWRATKGVPNG